MEIQKWPKRRDWEMEEKEIDLRDYIRMVKKRWKIILIVPLVACIISALVSFRLPKKYVASSLLGILETVATDEQGRIQRFGLKADFYETVVKNEQIVQEIIEELRLKQPPDNLTVKELIGMISTQTKPETSTLRITVEANTPQRAKDIANAIAEKMVEINRHLLGAQANKAKDFFGDQVKEAEVRMDKAEKGLLNFRKEADLDVLRQRVNNLLMQRGKFEIEFDDLLASIKIEETSLKQIGEHFEAQEKTFKLSKSLSEELPLREIMAKIAEEDLTALLGLKMESETVNPLYETLRKRLTDTMINLSLLEEKKSVLEKRIAKNEVELSRLEKELADKEAELIHLERVTTISREEYSMFVRKQASHKTMGAVSVGDITIIARAIEPTKPIKPKKRQNVLISGVLGLMIGFVSACLAEYFEKT